MRPRTVTAARLLLLFSGFIAVLTGVLALGPEAAFAARALGALLLVTGFCCWLLVWLIRRPMRRAWVGIGVATLAQLVLRLLQLLDAGGAALTVGLLGTVALPAVALLLLFSGSARRWLKMSQRDWQNLRDARQSAVRGQSWFRRLSAAIGAVGLAAGLLVVVGGSAVAAAALPCSFPEVTSAGLNSQSTTQTEHMPPTGTTTASDGTALAYYAFVPQKPVASLVFYHGSGANSNAGYLDFARSLAADYGVAVYLFDLRGHGNSAGPRGDAPSTDQVWRDTLSAVDAVRSLQPALPLFLGGHSAGDGTVINSEQLVADKVAGYVLVSPDLGLNSATTQTSGAANFASICTRAFVSEKLSHGLVDAHVPALQFAYTAESVASAGRVNRYTPTMENAQNPTSAAAVLGAMNRPVGVWIGAQDEVFNPDKVVDFIQGASSGPNRASVTVLPGVDHLGAINASVPGIGEWIRVKAVG